MGPPPEIGSPSLRKFMHRKRGDTHPLGPPENFVHVQPEKADADMLHSKVDTELLVTRRVRYWIMIDTRTRRYRKCIYLLACCTSPNNNVFLYVYFRAVVTSSAEMEAKAFPAKLLDKTFWNPRPEIDLASRAVSGESNSFHLILGHQN
jgi:hypothetical protein